MRQNNFLMTPLSALVRAFTTADVKRASAVPKPSISTQRGTLAMYTYEGWRYYCSLSSSNPCEMASQTSSTCSPCSSRYWTMLPIISLTLSLLLMWHIEAESLVICEPFDNTTDRAVRRDFGVALALGAMLADKRHLCERHKGQRRGRNCCAVRRGPRKLRLACRFASGPRGGALCCMARSCLPKHRGYISVLEYYMEKGWGSEMCVCGRNSVQQSMYSKPSTFDKSVPKYAEHWYSDRECNLGTFACARPRLSPKAVLGLRPPEKVEVARQLQNV